MANARIDRMLRELHSEPSFQFFQAFFNLRPALASAPTASPRSRSRSSSRFRAA